MDISAVGDDFDEDWFDARHLPATWNGHMIEISPSIPDHHTHVILAMNRPSEINIKGSYSEEQGFGGQIEFSWKNDPGPPPSSREKESSHEKESTNNERETSSRDSSSERTKDYD